MSYNEDVESEEERAFFSAKARAVWEKQLTVKGFISERGFGKFISLFSEIIEKKGWSFFCEHKAPGFSILAREFYSNMVEMRMTLYMCEEYGFLLGIRRSTRCLS